MKFQVNHWEHECCQNKTGNESLMYVWQTVVGGQLMFAGGGGGQQLWRLHQGCRGHSPFVSHNLHEILKVHTAAAVQSHPEGEGAPGCAPTRPESPPPPPCSDTQQLHPSTQFTPRSAGPVVSQVNLWPLTLWKDWSNFQSNKAFPWQRGPTLTQCDPCKHECKRTASSERPQLVHAFKASFHKLFLTLPTNIFTLCHAASRPRLWERRSAGLATLADWIMSSFYLSDSYDNNTFRGFLFSLLKKKCFKFTMKKSINQTFKSSGFAGGGHNGGAEGEDEGSAIM